MVYLQNIKVMILFFGCLFHTYCACQTGLTVLEQILRWLVLFNIEFLVRSFLVQWFWDETMDYHFYAPFLKRLGLVCSTWLNCHTQNVSRTSLLNELLSILECRFLVTNLLSLNYDLSCARDNQVSQTDCYRSTWGISPVISI